jgi:RND family efflux transporter MFP subunit
LEQQENQVIQAQNELDIEKGNQLVAQKEYALLNEQVSEEEMRLMLRQPQFSTLQTKLSIAKSQKEQAELNLSRTAIIAPFNGIVQSSNVNIGTWVSSGSVLAAMVGSDTYWVEVSVPEHQLDWVRLPVGNDGQGSRVKIFNTAAWEEEEFRDGRLIRLLPGLETKGRMARLLVEIDDPLALDTENNGKPKVMIGSFVRVEIEGRQIHRAVELPREYLRNGNQIWVYDETGKLAIQDVSIGFKNRDSVLITARVKDGESIVISDISTPVEGLVLKTMNSGNPHVSEPSENVAAIIEKTEPMIRGFENDE